MWQLLIVITHLVAFCLGLLALYSLFLYEDEQGKLQNRLEELWLTIDEAHHRAVSRHIAFMHGIARMVNAGLDRLFGARIISLRSIYTAACFSLASFYAVIFLGLILFTTLSQETSDQVWVEEKIFPNSPFSDATVAAILTLGFIALGLIPVFSRQLLRSVLVLFGACGLITFTLVLVGFIRYDAESLLYLSAVITGGLVSDLIFIGITRKLLRWSSGLDSFYKIGATIFLNCVLAIALIALPLAAGIVVAPIAAYGAHTQPRMFFLVAFSLFYIGVANLVISVVAFAFIFLAIVALIHRILWPLINRPIYALQQSGIARRKKLALTLGLALIGFSIRYAIPSLARDALSLLVGNG